MVKMHIHKKGVVMARKSIKRQVIPVPHDLDEAAEFLRQIGGEQRNIDTIRSTLNAEVDGLKARAMANVKPHQEKISRLVEGLYVYAESHRQELTDGGKRKTVEVPTGIFRWRITPPAVSLRNVKSILESLKSLELDRFIRIREEVNKEAMLKEPDIAQAIQGVSVSQREEFIVKPAELEVEITTAVKKLQKAVA